LHVPWNRIREYISAKNLAKLMTQTGILENDLCYAFDVYARSIQYHKILGEGTSYFAHPVRESAFTYLPTLVKYQNMWSWGQFFIQAVKANPHYRDTDWILEKIFSIKNTTQKYNATWYDLANVSEKAQVELLTTIAVESELPSIIKDETYKKIKLILNLGTVLSAFVPLLTVILGTGAVAVEFWNREMPAKAGKLSIIKGHLEWPGLTSKN
jgi:hypothetical protein